MNRNTSAVQVLDRHFVEMRCKLIEVAASMDRVDRCKDAERAAKDPRMQQLREAVGVLLDAGPGRAEKIQVIFSLEYDPAWRTR